jgi:peptide/nickel transport system substrate-binding protein
MRFASFVLATSALVSLAATPVHAAKDLLVVDQPGSPATLDPHVQWDTDSYTVYRNIFDNMVTRSDDGQIVAQVATSWTYLGDTQVEFQIRGDIVFHDGTKLTPEDVVYSVKRITDPAFKSPQLGQFNSIVNAEVTGPNKVKLTTSTPYPALMAQLVKLSIVPKDHVAKVGNDEFNRKPLGSGPYKLTQWQTGVRVALESNAVYWGTKGQFPKVEFRPVPEAATRIANMKSGRSDMSRGFNPDNVPAIKSDPNLQILSVPTERIAYLFVNPSWGPSQDVRVRRAMAHAIDRKLIIESLLGGFGRESNIMVTSASFGYIEGFKGYEYNPTKAKQLLAETGLKNIEITFITSPLYDQRVIQAVQQMLGDVGIKMEISSTDQPTFLKRRQGTPEDAKTLSMGNWSCACQDADGVIYPLFRSGSIWSKYNNAEFDAAVDAARSTLDEKKRLEHYKKAFEILERDLPAIALYQNVAIYGARKPLQWKPTPDESFFISRMAWKE